MEAKVSEILENILGLLGLEGSFEVVENDAEVQATIDTNDAGRLIGYRGETLDALQLIINQILSRSLGLSSKDAASEGAGKKDSYKRVVIDVAGWRKSKEEELIKRAEGWVEKVLETKEPMQLEPMPAWQRRIVHMVISEMEGVESESVGEGNDRYLTIKPTSKKSEKPEKLEKKAKKSKETPEEKSETEEPKSEPTPEV